MSHPTAPRPFVFVLMPFDRGFDDVYKLGIRPACENAGAYCERVDEQIFHESILQRIYNQIAKADIIVADMTGRNPNVFYETGYAHALGKAVVLLTQDADDIPFDLKHYPHIIYGGSIATLKDEVERRVRWHLESPGDLRAPAVEQLEFYLNGQRITQSAQLSVTRLPRGMAGYDFDLQLALHNTGDRIYNGSQEQLGIIVPRGVSLEDVVYEDDTASAGSIVLPDGNTLTIYKPIGQLLPGGWESIDVKVSVTRDWEYDPIPVIVRLFTGFGPRDLEFSVEFYQLGRPSQQA